MSAPDVAGGHDLEWHRPHPITILVEIGTAFRSFIFAIILVRGGGGFVGISALAEFLVVLAPLAAGLARWYTTRYALGPESVHYRHGLFRRRKQVLPRSNVQNVSSKAGIISRLASVVELQISDASSSGDIKLRLIGQDEAERLTTLLRSSMPQAPTTPGNLEPDGYGLGVGTSPINPSPAPGGAFDRPDRPDLPEITSARSIHPTPARPTDGSIAGGTNRAPGGPTDGSIDGGNHWAPARPTDGRIDTGTHFTPASPTDGSVDAVTNRAPSGPTDGSVDAGTHWAPGGELPAINRPSGAPVQRPPLVEPSLGTILRAETTSMSSLGALVASLLLAATGLALSSRLSFVFVPGLGRIGSIAALSAVPLLSALLTVAGRMPVLGGFRLHADPDRLRIDAGLLTETKVAARRERIQQIGVVRDLPHQWLGIERVKYETADVDLQTTAATRFLDPAGSTGGWKALATEAIGGTMLDESDLEAVSRITVRRTIIRLLPLALVPAAIGGLVHPIGAVVGAIGWLAIDYWYATRRFAVLGWASDDEHYLVRSGVFYCRLHLVRLDKVQSLRLTSSVLQRRFGLATLSLSTAGAGLVGLVSMPDLPLATGERLLDHLAARSARTPIDETL